LKVEKRSICVNYLHDLQANWDEFGQIDPLWAIAADPSKKGNKWELGEFFNSGRAEVDSVLDYLEELELSVSKRRALDFGCGVGRLTQALACHFNLVEGVDIAPSMIELADKFNRYGGRCKYYVNYAADLSMFEDEIFDFIYSNIVLQHINPEHSRNYINEFLRLLAPKGVLVFDLVTEASTFRGKLFITIYPLINPVVQLRHRFYRAVRKSPRMQVHLVKRGQVDAILQDNGAKLIDATMVEDKKYYQRVRYCVVKA
jgi:SAM-dependent methyltransferase